MSDTTGKPARLSSGGGAALIVAAGRSPRRGRPGRLPMHMVFLALSLVTTTTALGQPASSGIVAGEPMTLSYDRRQFDGGNLELVVLTAKSVKFVSDTFGAWTPHGAGKTDSGFILRHRRFPTVFVTLSPFAGPGPARSPEAWRSYRREVARQLGPETTNEDAGESGTPGGIPSFASWTTRETVFLTPAAAEPSTPVLTQRHVVASDGACGMLIMLAGPGSDVEKAEQDFRFLLARLERR